MKQRNRAHALTKKDWAELAAVEDVRDLWPLLDEEGSWELAETAHGVRFEFESEQFRGDVYILQGDYGTPPLVLSRGRTNGVLRVVDLDERDFLSSYGVAGVTIARSR